MNTPNADFNPAPPAVQEPTAPAAEPAAPPPEPAGPRKLKVADQELPEDVVVKGYMSAAQVRAMAEEANVTANQARQIIQMLQTDPLALLKDPTLGLSKQKLRELTEQYLISEIEEERITPQERARRQEQAELQAYRDKEEAARRAAEEAELSTRQQQYLNTELEEFKGAISKYDLPATTETLRRMAYIKLSALKAGYDMPSDLVAQEAANSYESEHQNLLGNLEGERLLKRLGPDILKKINAAQVAKFKGAKAAPPPPQQNNDMFGLGKKSDEPVKDANYWAQVKKLAAM